MTDGVRAYAVDAKTAEALWKKSEELVGEFFNSLHSGQRTAPGGTK
jgi:hypothetical protein